jgi:hypothetical protein
MPVAASLFSKNNSALSPRTNVATLNYSGGIAPWPAISLWPRGLDVRMIRGKMLVTAPIGVDDVARKCEELGLGRKVLAGSIGHCAFVRLFRNHITTTVAAENPNCRLPDGCRCYSKTYRHIPT